MANLRTSFTLDLGGNLITRAKAFSTSISGMARQIRSSLGGLNGVAAQAGKGLEALTGRYAAGLAGLGVSYKAAQAVMDSARLDKGLMRTSQTMGLTAQQAEEARRALFAMARETGQPVENLKAGLDRLGASGMAYEQALASIRAINPAMAVTGASADQLASALSVAGEIFKFDLSRPETAVRLLDQMTAAGRLGNAELEHLADIFARVGGNARNAGLSMTDTLALIEQMSLVEKQPERLATLVDSTLRLWNNENYRKQAEKVTGVKFFDEKGNRRNAFDILAEMSAKYGRIYTLTEFLTGTPKAAVELARLLTDWPAQYRPGSTFVDAVGNDIPVSSVKSLASADFENTPSLSMQIQGICPYGWHVANVQDFYDMLCAAAAAKGVTPNPLSAMIGKWSVPDVLRSAEGWSAAPTRHAAADAFGFDFFPQGRRLFKSGYQYYASRGEMFICHPGGLSSGVYQCWRINALTNNAADLTVSTTYNIGDCSASFRCVKNYENF